MRLEGLGRVGVKTGVGVGVLGLELILDWGYWGKG